MDSYALHFSIIQITFLGMSVKQFVSNLVDFLMLIPSQGRKGFESVGK